MKKQYLFFAEKEVHGRCPVYEALGLQIAGDAELIGLIATFPENKRQPNLILAALRKFLGHVPDFAEARAVMLNSTERLTEIVFSHNTQTNEPGRCATLLPLLCQLPQPLALLEIGASAGLCLIPDRYTYDYGAQRLAPAGRNAGLVLNCAASATVPLPKTMPEVVWRAGLDSNPLDIHDPEQRAWLETLVWPTETDRRERLKAAMDIAAGEALRIEVGDLHSDDLDRLVAQAPSDATLVIYHSAVLSYTLDPAQRDAFARRIGTLTDHWVSNESPALFSDFGRDLLEQRPNSDFLMALNGRPIAWADPHGASITWIKGADG
ncbi:MAG: hypothetical protein CSA68_06435 [Rhodobacterales bacterium]|nr:MAG: hypothetical protein CSA68_06435 [Rhodobacterales bacterium]